MLSPWYCHQNISRIPSFSGAVFLSLKRKVMKTVIRKQRTNIKCPKSNKFEEEAPRVLAAKFARLAQKVALIRNSLAHITCCSRFQWRVPEVWIYILLHHPSMDYSANIIFTDNFFGFGLCPSSKLFLKNDISKGGFASVFRQRNT